MLRKKKSFLVGMGSHRQLVLLFCFVLPPHMGFWMKKMEVDLDTAPSEKIAWLLLDAEGQHPENVLPLLVQQLTLERHRPQGPFGLGRIPSASPWMPHRDLLLQFQVVQPLESHRPTESRASRSLQHPVPCP